MSAPQSTPPPTINAAIFATTIAQSPPPYYNKHAGVDSATGMHSMRLGSTGAVVSRICLGLMTYTDDKPMFDWMMNSDKSDAFVKQALDAGITAFDTAEAYSDGGSERFFGAALQKLLPLSKYTREDLFVTTKIIPARTIMPQGGIGGIQKGLSRKAIFAALEGSLQRLQLDYVDLYLLHRYDPNTAPEETMRALHDLVVAGKVRYIGVSAMYLWQLCRLNEAAERNGWTKLVAMQSHYNAIYREDERETIPHCIDHELSITPFAPLAAGQLARQPTDDATARVHSDPMQKRRYGKQSDAEVIEAVQGVAKARGLPPAQVALAWLLSKSGVSAPIIGATKPHHIEDAVKALSVQLSAEEVAQIEEHYVPHVVTSHT